MDYNKFFQSKIFKTTLIVLGVWVILLLVFSVGEFVGYRRARFSYGWGENYHRNFNRSRGKFFKDFKRSFKNKDFINAHGAFGRITNIEGSVLTIQGRDDLEKIIFVTDSTIIKHFRDIVKLTDLKIEDYITIIGDPNDGGQIEAKFIRVMYL